MPWRLDDARAAARPDLAFARDLLLAHNPPDAEQAEIRERMLALIDRHPAIAHRRECLAGHLTASALVVDASATRILLLHHRKLGKWLQPGGHCDGDANLPAVALREATEESGLDGLEVDPRILDLDIHPIPARPGEPAHFHYDVRYRVVAPAGAEPRRNHEATDLRFFAVEDARAIAGDDSLRRLIGRVFRARPPA